MHVYRCDLTLHDYLFFATTERGKIAESGPFIHNYALTYALGLANSPWRNEVQQAHYPEELASAWKRELVYVTPAHLLRGATRINQYNTMGEGYKLSKKPSAAYPDWGFIKHWQPGSSFRFYVLSQAPKSFPTYLRLGKFMSKARLRSESAIHVKQASGECISEALLAWDDLKIKPVVFDLIANSIPTRLIRSANFTSISYMQAEFTDTKIYLPLDMGYLAAPDEITKRFFNKCLGCKEALTLLGQSLCTLL